ncbi:MAG: hypothetical protein KDA28_00885, partial [Phycisphaerales bacterium]|nr:hypothetical protein [Phycisphaerales bacterium]
MPPRIVAVTLALSLLAGCKSALGHRFARQATINEVAFGDDQALRLEVRPGVVLDTAEGEADEPTEVELWASGPYPELTMHNGSSRRGATLNVTLYNIEPDSRFRSIVGGVGVDVDRDPQCDLDEFQMDWRFEADVEDQDPDSATLEASFDVTMCSAREVDGVIAEPDTTEVFRLAVVGSSR